MSKRSEGKLKIKEKKTLKGGTTYLVDFVAAEAIQRSLCQPTHMFDFISECQNFFFVKQLQ